MAAAPQSQVNAPETPLTDASFEPYGRLLRMLMPSVRGIVVHDGFSNLVWASDEWNLADSPQSQDELCPFCNVERSAPVANQVLSQFLRCHTDTIHCRQNSTPRLRDVTL